MWCIKRFTPRYTAPGASRKYHFTVCSAVLFSFLYSRFEPEIDYFMHVGLLMDFVHVTINKFGQCNLHKAHNWISDDFQILQILLLTIICLIFYEVKLYANLFVSQAESLWCQMTHDLVPSRKEGFWFSEEKQTKDPIVKSAVCCPVFLDSKIVLPRFFTAQKFWRSYCSAILEPFALLVCLLGTPPPLTVSSLRPCGFFAYLRFSLPLSLEWFGTLSFSCKSRYVIKWI